MTLIQFISEFLILPVEEVLVEVTMPGSEGNPEKSKTCEYLNGGDGGLYSNSEEREFFGSTCVKWTSRHLNGTSKMLHIMLRRGGKRSSGKRKYSSQGSEVEHKLSSGGRISCREDVMAQFLRPCGV